MLGWAEGMGAHSLCCYLLSCKEDCRGSPLFMVYLETQMAILAAVKNLLIQQMLNYQPFLEGFWLDILMQLCLKAYYLTKICDLLAPIR